MRCDSATRRARWETHGRLHPDLEIDLHDVSSSWGAWLNQIMAGGGDHAIVCHADIMLPREFGRRAQEVIAGLEARLPGSWGIVANVGLAPNGEDLYSFVGPGLRKTADAALVAVVGEGAAILNLRALRDAGVQAPDLAGDPGQFVTLSLECYRLGLACFVDGRLFAFRDGVDNAAAIARFLEADPFGGYWSTRFLNHAFSTQYGRIDLSSAVRYEFLDFAEEAPQVDVHQLYEAALDRMVAALGASMTIACRTILTRPALLARAVQSFATAAARCPGLDVRVKLLSSGTSAADLQAEVDRLRPLVPRLRLEADLVPVTERYSRTELMVHALRRAETDYVWFVDDDDFALADSLLHIRSAFNLGKRNIIVADSQVYEEVWDPGPGNAARLLDWKVTGGFSARNCLQSLGGFNLTPNCSVVFPVALMRPVLERVAALGDYNEDYFFFCLAMSAPGAEVTPVSRPIAGISRHNLGRTQSNGERLHWHDSYSTFIGELVATASFGSPVFWSLAQGYADRQQAARFVQTQMLQLFVPARGSFTEETSLQQLLAPGNEPRDHVFVFDRPPVPLLRLDVGATPAYIALERIALAGGDGVPVKTWSPATGWAGLHAGGDMTWIPTADGSLHAVATGRDPQLVIPLPSEPLGPLRLEIRLLYLPWPPEPEFERIGRLMRTTFAEGAPPQLLRLCWVREGQLSSAASAVVAIEGRHDLQEHAFRVPDAEGSAVRLDIGAVPAFATIEHIALKTAHHGRRWSAETGREGLQPLRNSAWAGRESLDLVLTGSDPQLLIELGEALDPGSALEVTVALRYRPWPVTTEFQGLAASLDAQTKPASSPQSPPPAALTKARVFEGIAARLTSRARRLTRLEP